MGPGRMGPLAGMGPRTPGAGTEAGSGTHMVPGSRRSCCPEGVDLQHNTH